MDGDPKPKSGRKWSFPLGMLLVSLLLFGLGQAFPWAAEGIYGWLFPWIARSLSLGFGVVPLSVSELGLGVLALVFLWKLTRGLRPLLWATMWAGCLIASSGILLWGLNHCRPPMAERLGWDLQQPTEDELVALIVELVRDLDRLEDQFTQEQLAPDQAHLEALLTGAFDRQSQKWSWLRGPRARVRRPLVQGLLARAGISGVYSPWTGEAHIEPSLPGPLVWATAAHEVAHQRGIAREDEANFVAWFVLRHSPNPAARYSARFVLLGQALNALGRQDRHAAQDLMGKLSPSLRRRRAAVRAYWQDHLGTLSRISHRVNDSYLKVAGHRQGAQTYGLVLDLVLADRRYN